MLQIPSETGVKNIIDHLHKLFKKDETLQKYQALEAFETYRRPTSSSIQEFLYEFEKRYNKTKSFGTTMQDDILAYRLLKSANLSEQHEQLAKAIVSDLKFNLMKDQFKKIFGDLSAIPTADFSDSVKTENVNQTEHESKCQDTLHTRGRARGASRGKYSRPHEQYSYQTSGQSSKGAFSRSVITCARCGRNPSDGQGNPTKCSICESIIGHNIVLTKSRMNMTHITVITLYCSSQSLIIHLNYKVLECSCS